MAGNMGVTYPLMRQADIKQEALMDPVNKFRVSQPETLIDTDFEYGLQSTKWETVEMVNNVPTFFSRNGDDSIALSEVTVILDSFLVTVTTASAHGLMRGSPIIITGLNSVTAEGSYCVLSVISATQFVYRARQKQTFTRSIFDSYSSYLFPARVFQATQYTSEHITSMVTDAADQSGINVTTDEPHGFSVGSSFILNNSIGSKVVEFDATLVDPVNINTTTYDISTTAVNPDGSGFLARALVPYAFQSKRSVFFNPLTSVAANVITAPSHGLETGESVMYVAPPGDNAMGGLTPYRLYSVVRIDASSFRLRDFAQSVPTSLSSGLLALRYDNTYHNENPQFNVTLSVSAVFTPTDWTSNSVIGIPSNAGGNIAYSVMVIGYFLASATGSWTFYTTSDDGSYMWVGDTATSGFTTANALVKNGGGHAMLKSPPGTVNLTAGVYYPVRVVMGNGSGPGDMNISFLGPGVAERTNGAGYFFHTWTSDFAATVSSTDQTLTPASASVTNGLHALLKAYPVRSVNNTTDMVTLWMSASASLNAPLALNDAVAIFSGDSLRAGFGLENFAPASSNVYSAPTSATPNYTLYYVRNSPAPGASNTDVQLSLSAGGSVRDVTSANRFVFGLTWAVPVQTLLEFSSVYYASHGFSTNDPITYSVAAGTGPSGLVSGTTYFAEVISASMFRLKTAAGSGAVVPLTTFGAGTLRFVRTVANPTANTVYALNHDLVDGTPVVYSNNGNATIPGLANGGTYYVIGATSTRFCVTTARGSAANTVDITAAGTGKHFVSCREAIDGNYSIVNVPTPTSFTLQAGFKIPLLELTINTSKNVILALNVFYVPGHRLTTGTAVTYSMNANASPIGGLVNDQTYYIIRVDTNCFRLATTLTAATAGTAVSITSFAAAQEVHSLRTNVLTGEFGVPGVGFALTGNAILTCSAGIDFLSNYRIGDPFFVEIPTGATTINIASVDATNDILTTTAAHNLLTGQSVWYMSATATAVISGLSQNTLYFVNVLSATTLRLFNTAANAVANTNFIDLQSTSALGMLSRLPNASVSVLSIAIATDTLTVDTTHGWTAGDVVLYTAAASGAIAGLADGCLYYVSVPATNQLKLHDAYSNALAGTSAADLTSSTLTGTHTLARIRLNSVFSSVVAEVKSATAIRLSAALPSTAPTCTPVITTFLYPRADGYAMHRAFDGGVEIIPSINPDSQIIRQTKKYFRYQSGKGIQLSKAVNFSAPNSIESMTRDGAVALATTKRPHRLSPGVNITIDGVASRAPTFSGDSLSEFWNGSYVVASVPTINSFTFVLSSIPQETIAGGYPQFYVDSWLNSVMRVGLFDDQNGIFYEYNGQELNAVRRNSVKQLAGTASVTFNRQLVVGDSSARFTTSVAVGDRVVIKGQSYKVVQVVNDATMYVQPPYRGTTASNITLTRTIDFRVPQSSWSIDKCDGTGPTAYTLDIHKIQMIYIDYAWYGAGKVRFGFKDRFGRVVYVHEFVHNNRMTEAYMRSGNLPARYEVATVGVPTYVPALMHWGTSVIMDGRFDEDQAYLFTASGAQISYASGDVLSFSVTFTDTRQNFVRTYRIYDPTQGVTVTCYRLYTANLFNTLQNLRSGTALSGNGIADGTKLVGSPLKDANGTGTFLYIDRQPILPVVTGAQTVTAGDPTDFLPNFIPLISIRLAPSVDNGRPGAMGSREIVNRMQLILKSLGILNTHDCEVRLLLNCYPYNKTWQRVTPPSLSQLVYHVKNDTVEGGTQVYSFRASGGTPDTSGRRTSANSTIPLTELANLGNSIVGGDDVFPNGPDVLTIGATVLDTSGITISTPLTITARVTWAESQA